MSKLYEAFLPYRDQFGLNQLKPGLTEQNGVLCTVEYLLCLLADKDTPKYLKNLEIQRIILVFNSLEKELGYLTRFPGSGEIDSMDNNGAALVFSKLFDSAFFGQFMQGQGLHVQSVDVTYNPEDKWIYYVANALNFFRGPKNFWNNQDHYRFHREAWFGRSPGFMGLLDIAAWGNTTWFRALGLLLGQMYNGEGTSGAKLAYINWQILKDRSFLWSYFYKRWVTNLLKKYPNGMRDVYSIYYTDPNHPIKTYSQVV